MKFWRKQRAITLVQIGENMCNNPKLDLAKMNAFIKFGEILPIGSQDIVVIQISQPRVRNTCDVNQLFFKIR